jgi:hypothetical protein
VIFVWGSVLPFSAAAGRRESGHGYPRESVTHSYVRGFLADPTGAGEAASPPDRLAIHSSAVAGSLSASSLRSLANTLRASLEIFLISNPAFECASS